MRCVAQLHSGNLLQQNLPRAAAATATTAGLQELATK